MGALPIAGRRASERDYYAYVIFRPNGVPCYVGKGKGNRCNDLRNGRNSHLKRIIAKANDVPVIKVRTGLTEAEAFETEVALIAAIGREVDGGPLVNLSKGGEGKSGYKHTEAELAKMRARTFSDETRARISEGLKRRPPASQETREKLRARNIGRKMTAESIAKTVAANRALNAVKFAELREVRAAEKRAMKAAKEAAKAIAALARAEARAAKKAAAKLKADAARKAGGLKRRGQKRSPEACARIAAGLRGRICSPETRAKKRENAKKQWQSAETRAGMIVAIHDHFRKRPSAIDLPMAA